MDDRELLTAFEQYAREAFGLRISHVYDRRVWRRHFHRMSLGGLAPHHRTEASGPPWEPLLVFRDRNVQHAAETTIRDSAIQRLELKHSNFLLPLSVSPLEDVISQRAVDSIFESFVNHRYLREKPSIQSVHQEFATIFLFTMISDRVMIVETDFSHERNMALKYVIRPFENRVLRTLPVSKRSNLFFSKQIAGAARNGVYFGVQPTLQGIFNREIGYSDLESLDGAEQITSNTLLDGRPISGFLVAATRMDDYSCAYIVPLYSVINRDSSVLSRLNRLFFSFCRILFNEAQYRIDRNKHHSRLRHTIGVEVDSLSFAYGEIFSKKSAILERFTGNREALNIQMSQVNNHLEELAKDVQAQFATQFDVLGNKKERRALAYHSLEITPDELRDLIKDAVSAVQLKKRVANITFSFDHKNSVIVGSETSLRNSLRELVNNAIKYNITGSLIRIRSKDVGDEVAVTINNIGPAVTKEEADQIPLMGLRGMNAQRHVVEGSGQGMASVFGILNAIGVYPKYEPRALSPEQLSRLRTEIGSKRLRSLDLASHTIELTFTT